MSNAVVTALLLLPFVLILWLANFADRRSEGQKRHALAALTHGLLAAFYGGLFLVGLVLHAAAASSMPLPPQTIGAFQQMGVDAAEVKAVMSSMGLGLWLPALLGIALLLRPVRRLVARLIPIDPTRTVHAVALSYSALILLNLLATLGIGLGNIATTMEAGVQASPQNMIVTVWTMEIMLAATALVGVGWLSRRSLAQTLERLGVVMPSLRQAAMGLGVGLLLVAVALAFDKVAELAGLSLGEDVDRLTEALIGPLFHTLPGILTLGLAAALGEETVFRGALQPRFGLLVTAGLFALLHSNYGLTLATLAVLILGLFLGLLRQRANTTSCMIAHAVYNISLGLAVYLNLF